MRLKTYLLTLSILAFTVAGCSSSPFSGDKYASIEDTPQQRASTFGTSRDISRAPDPAEIGELSLPEQPPPLGTSNFTPVAPESLNPTGTLAGVKVQQLRDDLILLQNAIAEQNSRLQDIRNESTKNTQYYHSIVAAINTRLQIGTTPGNPAMIEQWNKAQDMLERMNRNISDMNNLSNEVAGSATLTSYLLDAVKAAYTLSGAIEEDHRQLGILENDINRTMVLVDRLLGELAKDVSRQTNYVNNEKRNLTLLSLAIKNGELYGRSLSSSQYAPPPMPPNLAPFRGSASGSLRSAAPAQGMMANAAPQQLSAAPNLYERPLVVIRFHKPHVSYERPLYNAVSQALKRKTDVAFTLVSAVPQFGSYGGNSALAMRAEKNAEKVMQSLYEMGIPAGNVKISSVQDAGIDTNEVRLYVR